MIMISLKNCVANQIKEKSCVSYHYSHVEEGALNIGMRCNKSIIIFVFQFLFYNACLNYHMCYIYINAKFTSHMTPSFNCI
jgi:hypothetical protein